MFYYYSEWSNNIDAPSQISDLSGADPGVVHMVRLNPSKLKLIHLKTSGFGWKTYWYIDNKHYIISFEKKKRCDEKEKKITLVEESLSWF